MSTHLTKGGTAHQRPLPRSVSFLLDERREGRCLELGRGNEEIAFGRAACLDVNAEIVEMAKSGPGYALYFTCEGLIRL